MNYTKLYDHYTVEEKAKLCDQMLEKLGMMHELYSERRTDVCEFITYIADPDTHRPKAESRFVFGTICIDVDTLIEVEYDSLTTEIHWRHKGSDEFYKRADDHEYYDSIDTPSTFEELMRREK